MAESNYEKRDRESLYRLELLFMQNSSSSQKEIFRNLINIEFEIARQNEFVYLPSQFFSSFPVETRKKHGGVESQEKSS